MTTAIQADALAKHFSPEIRAVDGIDLSIEEGRIFGYLGANGSGKTTTVRIFTTLLRPSSGRAEVMGLDVVAKSQRVRQTVGVALQEAGLDDLQTGRELLGLQGRLFGLAGRKLSERVDYLLAVVDLEDAADRRVGTYSGGMKRRLDLAAALIHDPRTLFLDEPTTGLDPISREAIWKYITQLNREEGVTVFLTTQYLEEADRLADQVAIIDRGKIIAEGSPEELKAGIGTDVITAHIEGDDDELARAHEALRGLGGADDVRLVNHSVVVYVRDGARQIAPIVLKLTESGLRVGEVTLSRPTLDDVFLRKTGHHIETDGRSPAEQSTEKAR
ncbi:MAG TPA: ATP-binding cassette domain-containing protein [Dehalococcoidia bacterium]|nr:ATP-binding cassette domain-containing protein [Dehalococcoidia bacterium]